MYVTTLSCRHQDCEELSDTSKIILLQRADYMKSIRPLTLPNGQNEAVSLLAAVSPVHMAWLIFTTPLATAESYRA